MLFRSPSERLETNSCVKNDAKCHGRGRWPCEGRSPTTAALTPCSGRPRALPFTGTLCEHRASGEIRKAAFISKPRLKLPRSRPFLFTGRPGRPRSTLVGSFVSEGPVSISPLWFLISSRRPGFEPGLSRRGPPGTRPGAGWGPRADHRA